MKTVANPGRFSAVAAPVARPLPLWVLYPLFFTAVYCAHWPLLRLPYFWDEAGYYIPAALDFLRTGWLIPHSTLTNAHPPLPSILLAGWWRVGGFVPIATRTLVCMISSAALLAVFGLARMLAGNLAAVAVTVLTAIYPVFFVQSTLAHADIFAACFTLWALVFYFEPYAVPAYRLPGLLRSAAVAILFSLAALSKETAIVTPFTLAAWEVFQRWRETKGVSAGDRRPTWPIVAALLFPILPLAAWYVYHYAQTGFAFGNPEFLRYNATANLTPVRVLLSLWHRIVHLTFHMNLWVPVLATIALLRTPPVFPAWPINRRPVLLTIAIIILGNALAFSFLGGALLTRYLLPMYPLLLLAMTGVWMQRARQWGWIAGLSAIAFYAALCINPPYAFAPEDNLTYRDMIVLHQGAIRFLQQRYPEATVLSAWPATSELEYPELGYTRRPFKVTPIENFTAGEIARAAADPGAYDTALIFSTKWTPPPGHLSFARLTAGSDRRYFDAHDDLQPAEVAARLHGEIVWQASRNGEWAAVLHFPRIVEASLSR